MVINSGSSIKNTNNKSLWIWKSKCILEFNKQSTDIDRIYLFAKDPYEAKYQFLINKRESTGLKRFGDPKAFIEYSNDMQDVYKDIDKYNVDKERKY